MLPDEVKQFLLKVADARQQSELDNLRTEAARLLIKYVYRTNGAGPREFKDIPTEKVNITPVYKWD